MSATAGHKSLAEALAAFQAECPTLAKDATNPHFRSKFTPLDTMVETVGPILSRHGLSWSAFPCFAADGTPALRYVLRHVSGEVESETMPLLVTKADPQGMGSAITYARRYSLAAVLNLVADEDDDGNAGSRRPENGAQRKEPLAPRVTAEEIKALTAAAKGLPTTTIKLAFAACALTPPDPFVPGKAFDGVPRDKAQLLTEALAGAKR